MQAVLADAGSIDFLAAGTLMSACFRAAPWNENWTPEQAEKYLTEMVSSETDFAVVRDEQDSGVLLGLGVGRALVCEEREPALLRFGIPSLTYHIHEIMVASQLRGRGLAVALTNQLLIQGVKRGREFSSSRTRFDNTGMLKVFRTCGYQFYGAEELAHAGTTHLSCVFGRPLRDLAFPLPQAERDA